MRWSCLCLCYFCFSAIATDITFFYYREQGRSTFKELINEFSSESGHQVSMHRVLSGELKQALVKSVLAGQSADAVFAPSDIVSIAYQTKLSVVPSDWIDTSTSSNNLASVTIEGKSYGVPILQGNHLMLFYNKHYVETPAATWQDLIDQHADIQKKGLKTIGWNYSEIFWFAGFYNTFGGRMTEGNRITLDTPAMHETLHFYKSLADLKLVTAECEYSCGYNDFVDGKVAYAINGEWAVADLHAAMGDNLGIALIPDIGDRPFRPMSSSLALVFPDSSLDTSKRQAIKELALFFQRSDVQQRLYDDTSFLPVNQALFGKIKQQAPANVQAMLSQLEQSVAMSPEAAQSSAWVGIHKGFELYMQGLADAAKASTFMQQYAERDFRRNSENRQR